MRTPRKQHTGLLIAFEGGEGVGKSTQITLLSGWLKQKGLPFLVTRQPGGTPMGRSLRRLLLSPKSGRVGSRAELLLYEADRAHHVESVILPALQSGKVVISDRFTDSSTVYQGICRGLGKEWTEKLNGFATNSLAPDLVILIDLPVSEGRKRISSRGELDKMELEKLEFHQKVRAGFLSLARKSPKRFLILNGKQPKQTIAQIIQNALEKRLRKQGLLK